MSFDYESPFAKDCKELTPLEEIGNAVAEDSPFEEKENSTFHTKKCGEYGNDFYKEGVDYQKLIYFLSNSNLVECFDWREFTSQHTTVTVPVDLLNSVEFPIPYKINKGPEQGEFTFIHSVQLNKNICEIYKDPSYSYELNLGSKKQSNNEILFNIKFYYYGTAQYRVQVKKIDSVDGRQYKIDSKYLAIKLNTSSTYDFYTIGSLLAPHDKHLFPLIAKEAYTKAYTILKVEGRKNEDEINWFYSNIPSSLISELPIDGLLEDIVLLLRYDKKILAHDSGTNILKLIRGIDNKEGGIIKLYDMLKKDAPLIKELHLYASDEVAYIDVKGETHTYQDLFADLIAAVTKHYYNTVNKPLIPLHSFKIGPKYQVDSNISGDDKYNDRYNIRQEKYISTYDYNGGIFIASAGFEPVEEFQYLHPLDLVTLIEVDEKDNIITQKIVPALVVKNIAYKNEWEKVDTTVRIIGDIVAVIGGIAGLFTGNPFLIGVAIGDILVAGGDLVIMAARETIEDMEGGKRFLAFWDDLYGKASLILAITSAPQTVKSLLTSGGNLLKIGKVFDQVDEIEDVLTMVSETVFEIHKAQFPEKSFQSIQMGAKSFSDSFSPADIVRLERLEKNGIILSTLSDYKGGKSFSAIYEGKIIATGSTTDFKRTLKSVWFKNGKNLTYQLRKLGVRIKDLHIHDYSEILSIDDIQKIVGFVRRHPLLKNFDIVKISNEGEKYATFIKEWAKYPTQGFFMPKTGIHPTYKIPLEGPKVYLFDDLIDRMDGVKSVVSPKYNLQQQLYHVESMTYIKESISLEDIATFARSRALPSYVNFAHSLSEMIQSKAYANSIGILTDLNTLNSLISNYNSVTGKQISEMTINDLKKWSIIDELIELNIIPE